MSIVQEQRPSDGTPNASSRPFIVDSDAHSMPLGTDLSPYLPDRWRRYVDLIGLRTPSETGLVRARPRACRADAWSPSGAPPGSDPEFFREDLLDRWGIDVAIVNPTVMSQQGLIGGNQPTGLTAALMTAGNEWTAEQWVASDERIYASISTPFEEGKLAVREIERWADHPRFVQILLPFRTQAPIGSRRYWDLIEAAVHHDLPLALHPGGTGTHAITAAGWPSFYYEDHVGLPQALYHQMASLVCEGVFDRWPTLKIVFQEGGWSWVRPFCWRFDRGYADLRDEVGHLERKPSEYIADHFWFTSQPMEEPERPEQFVKAWAMFDMPDRLLFSTDYPHWDFDAPEQALPGSLRDDVRQDIFARNALELYEPKLSGIAGNQR